MYIIHSSRRHNIYSGSATAFCAAFTILQIYEKREWKCFIWLKYHYKRCVCLWVMSEWIPFLPSHKCFKLRVNTKEKDFLSPIILHLFRLPSLFSHNFLSRLFCKDCKKRKEIHKLESKCVTVTAAGTFLNKMAYRKET